MRVGIVGAGSVGAGLGKFWAASGHEVMLSGSRDEAKLRDTAAGVGATPGSVGEAAEFGDAVLVAVPWPVTLDFLSEAGPMEGKVLVDATNNMLDKLSSFNEITRAVPGARVVKSFNTVFAALYDELEATGVRPEMVFCGDDEGAKRVVVQLIEDAGFNPVDVGGSEHAVEIEEFARMVIFTAYAQRRGPFVYRFARPSEL
jgi:8-hydroxy-5-deazaflavin:NADPH oxidoreductase